MPGANPPPDVIVPALNRRAVLRPGLTEREIAAAAERLLVLAA
jgi:hypothetical protein